MIVAGRLKCCYCSNALNVSRFIHTPSFDERLQVEIRAAKKVQTTKTRRQESPEGKSLGGKTLRDSIGFKVRQIESSTRNKSRKLEDPPYEVAIKGNLRFIKPYYFTYKTYCKERWRGSKLLDVFTREFRDRKKSYYKDCIENGSVYVNDKPAHVDTILRDSDLISHRIHRHEPPVMATPVGIVWQDQDILVIDKPSGIPVHPTGRYRFNTVTKMLEKQLGYTVHPCNRLDRLTSGLMFLAKTPRGADAIGDQLKSREVSKEYIARVVGEFPLREVIVERPLKSYDPRIALNVVCNDHDTGAKHAKTVFNRVSFDGRTSIVQCRPLTGRQHQIRVHLQFLGHPIANDPIYSDTTAWGSSLGKGGLNDYTGVGQKLHEVGKTRSASTWIYRDIQGEVLLEETCPECGTELNSVPDARELTLWLHAYRYKSKSEDSQGTWDYKTAWPGWAEPNATY